MIFEHREKNSTLNLLPLIILNLLPLIILNLLPLIILNLLPLMILFIFTSCSLSYLDLACIFYH